MKTVFIAIVCHLLGDYPLQIDYIAKTKGENWYHLLVHCMLYTVPFAVAFGIDWRLIPLFATHVVVDALKARWKRIGYVADQVIHYVVAFGLYILVGGTT